MIARLLRSVLPLVVLAVLVVRFGWQPIRAGLRATDAETVLAALTLTAVATVCCACRWQSVAAQLDGGPAPPLKRAVAMYYRSQLLNATLPLGVAGDVHRGVSHGRGTSGAWRGVRSVAAERCVGQVVAAALTVAVLLVVRTRLIVPPAPLRLGLATVVLTAIGTASVRWPRVVLTSVVVTLAHGAVFVVAVRATSADVGTTRAFALGLLVLLLGSLPLNLAGWGPREGAAAWVFASAGLGAGVGLAASVAFGVLSLLATTPGLLVLARPQVTADA